MKRRDLTFEETDKVAKAVAYKAVGLEMDDVFQEIRLKFWIYKPRTWPLAWRLASSVRSGMRRKEETRLKLYQRLAAGEQPRPRRSEKPDAYGEWRAMYLAATRV